MEDQTLFKLKIAQRYLAKIPKTVPKNTLQQQKLEENAEVFVFFASSIIEILKREINDRFEIFDKKNIFYIHGLRKNLANSGAQKKTKSAIASYFTTPKHTKNKVDVTKSGLWRLQALRNQAMHGSIIVYDGRFLVFSYTIHDKTNYRFVQKTQNPQRYFGQILHDLERFMTQIRTILGCPA